MLYQNAKIKEVLQENSRVKTFTLDSNVHAEPGQFLMAWVPGLGERPMSIAGAGPLQLSVASVGKVSSALHAKKIGEKIFFRGPYGNSFTLRGKKIILVGGGYGVAPMRFLARVASQKKISATLIMGAKTKSELMLSPSKKACETIICTDDGSSGLKGFTTDALASLLEKGKAGSKEGFDAVYACGPELMMKKIAEQCAKKKICCELSLERVMKCGVGLCGSCGIDEKLCCYDGPIFSGEEALKMKEFGSFAKH